MTKKAAKKKATKKTATKKATTTKARSSLDKKGLTLVQDDTSMFTESSETSIPTTASLLQSEDPRETPKDESEDILNESESLEDLGKREERGPSWNSEEEDDWTLDGDKSQLGFDERGDDDPEDGDDI